MASEQGFTSYNGPARDFQYFVPLVKEATDLYDLAIKGVVPEGEAGAPGQTNFIALQRCWEKCEEILHEPDLPDEFYIQLAYYRSAYQQNYYSHSLLDQALAKANKFEESEFYEHPMKKVIEEELKNRFSEENPYVGPSTPFPGIFSSPYAVPVAPMTSFLANLEPEFRYDHAARMQSGIRTDVYIEIPDISNPDIANLEETLTVNSSNILSSAVPGNLGRSSSADHVCYPPVGSPRDSHRSRKHYRSNSSGEAQTSAFPDYAYGSTESHTLLSSYDTESAGDIFEPLHDLTEPIEAAQQNLTPSTYFEMSDNPFNFAAEAPHQGLTRNTSFEMLDYSASTHGTEPAEPGLPERVSDDMAECSAPTSTAKASQQGLTRSTSHEMLDYSAFMEAAPTPEPGLTATDAPGSSPVWKLPPGATQIYHAPGFAPVAQMVPLNPTDATQPGNHSSGAGTVKRLPLELFDYPQPRPAATASQAGPTATAAKPGQPAKPAVTVPGRPPYTILPVGPIAGTNLRITHPGVPSDGPCLLFDSLTIGGPMVDWHQMRAEHGLPYKEWNPNYTPRERAPRPARRRRNTRHAEPSRASADEEMATQAMGEKDKDEDEKDKGEGEEDDGVDEAHADSY